ncbi:hypothetical protein D3C79_848080 [compost metagenome]
MLDVQHGQNDQEQYRVDEDELHVRVVGDPEELVVGNTAIFRTSSELKTEEGRRGRGHAVGAVGERHPVGEHKPDDFPKPQGDDRQVVTMHS